MTPEQIKALLPVLTAYASGEAIQHRIPDGTWYDCQFPSFNATPDSYRIKPFTRCWSEWQSQYERDSCRGQWFATRDQADAVAADNRFAVIRRDLEQDGDCPTRIVRVEIEEA